MKAGKNVWVEVPNPSGDVSKFILLLEGVYGVPVAAMKPKLKHIDLWDIPKDEFKNVADKLFSLLYEPRING